jgi:hypothetical protein
VNGANAHNHGGQLGMGLGQLQKVEMGKRHIHFTAAFPTLITGEMQAWLKKEHKNFESAFVQG